MNQEGGSRQLRARGLLQALASDKPNMAAYQSLWLAAQMWLLTGGGIPMERHLGLPATGPALRQANRDLWIRRAATLIEIDACTPASHALHREFHAFLTRGPWLFWKEKLNPPVDASELRQALFFVAKFNDGDSISLRTIQRTLS